MHYAGGRPKKRSFNLAYFILPAPKRSQFLLLSPAALPSLNLERLKFHPQFSPSHSELPSRIRLTRQDSHRPSFYFFHPSPITSYTAQKHSKHAVRKKKNIHLTYSIRNVPNIIIFLVSLVLPFKIL